MRVNRVLNLVPNDCLVRVDYQSIERVFVVLENDKVDETVICASRDTINPIFAGVLIENIPYEDLITGHYNTNKGRIYKVGDFIDGMDETVVKYCQQMDELARERREREGVELEEVDQTTHFDALCKNMMNDILQLRDLASYYADGLSKVETRN